MAMYQRILIATDGSELAAKGLLTPFEAKQLVKHEGTLKLIRARLHMVAGRREDRLVFDLQTAVADSFGYKATPANGQRSSACLAGSLVLATSCWASSWPIWASPWC